MKTKKTAVPLASPRPAEWLEEIRKSLPPLSSLEEAARTLGCSVRTARRFIISKELVTVKLGKRHHVTRDSIVRLLEARAC
jgi:excisionase family DNA binding protein